MSWTTPASDPTCPLPAADDAAVLYASVSTGTACLALMDDASVDVVWEDLLFDGHDHDHGAGGLMLNTASLGTHLDYDGDFPVWLFTNAAGQTVRFEVDLDPYGDDLDSLRRPDDWTHDHDHDPGHDHDADHGHEHGLDPHAGHHPDGWSEPVSVRLLTASAVFGDPAGLPVADATGGLLPVTFPASAGLLRASTYTRDGIRRRLVVTWSE